jgi:hypothetical protein
MRRAARVADDQGDAVGGGEDAVLAPHAPVSEHFAMVGGDDHEGAVGEAARVEPVEDAAEMGVHLRQQAEIDGAERGGLVGGEAAAIARRSRGTG